MREKPITIGAQIAHHGRYLVFRLAEVALPRVLFAEMLHRIEGLRAPPLLAT